MQEGNSQPEWRREKFENCEKGGMGNKELNCTFFLTECNWKPTFLMFLSLYWEEYYLLPKSTGLLLYIGRNVTSSQILPTCQPTRQPSSQKSSQPPGCRLKSVDQIRSERLRDWALLCLNLDVPPSQGNETSGCRPCGCLFHTKRRLTNHYNTPPPDVSPRSVGTLSNQPADPQTVVCLMFYPPNTTRQASAVPVVAFHLKRRLTSHYNTLPTRDVPMVGWNLFKLASLPANRPTSLKLYPPVATRQAGAVSVVLFPHQETLEEPLQLTSTRHVLEVGLSFVKPTSQPAIQPAGVDILPKRPKLFPCGLFSPCETLPHFRDVVKMRILRHFLNLLSKCTYLTVLKYFTHWLCNKNRWID